MEAGKLFTAWWIGPAYDPRQDLGFFEFAIEFELDSVPDSIIARVSADQRYTLLVNGEICLRGPQRGDPQHWFFETIDLAPNLIIGKNRIVAEVTNFGWMAPMAQHSVRTAFLFEAEEPFAHLSTSGNWQVRRRLDRDFAMMSEGIGEFYIDVGPGEIFTIDNKSEHEPWRPAHRICRAEIRGEVGGGSPWSLIPRKVPKESFGEIVKPKRVLRREAGQLSELRANAIGIKSGAEVILDFGEIVVGYPTVWISHSNQLIGDLKVTYCESFVDSDGAKGTRSGFEDKTARGYEDLIQFRGGDNASINPSWLRTFRYISLKSGVDVDHCTVEAFRSGFPMQVDALFDCNEPTIQPIWDLSVRALKLCAGETYYDCPYYEQLQYIGDTRLQALIGYYLSRDRTLQRNAIEQFHWSILESGLTQSRYPSRQMQVIPPFSLWWVVMIYDAWMHDPGFDPRPYLHGARGVLEAYQKVCKGELEPFWCFGDWVPDWKWGVPPGGPNAEMHLVLFEMAKWCFRRLSWEVGLFGRVGHVGQTDLIQIPIEETSLTCPTRPTQISPPTEHAEALWRYFQTLSDQKPDPWDEEILENAPKCTYFWQYVKHVGMQPEDYVSLLNPWREMLALGLTTTPETPEPTRSDCHGWSAHPPLGLLQLVAGVTSIAPGWAKARIAPRPGSLLRFKAVIPHPSGDIEVELENENLRVVCPVHFELDWKNETKEYEPGKYQF